MRKTCCTLKDGRYIWLPINENNVVVEALPEKAGSKVHVPGVGVFEVTERPSLIIKHANQEEAGPVHITQPPETKT